MIKKSKLVRLRFRRRREVEKKQQQQYSNMITHPAQGFVDRLWDKIDSDCYYNFSDMPAHYSQLRLVKVIQLVRPESAYDYKLNRVFYPNDVDTREALLDISQNFIRKILEGIANAEDDSDSNSE